MRLLGDGKRRLITTDELRRCIEELGPGAYDEMSYYERWIASITNNLLEKGVITVDELGRRMAQIGEAWPAGRSEEHTSELQSLMRHSSAVFCLQKKNKT